MPIGLDEPYRIVVGNNPVNFVDPLGLFGWDTLLKFGLKQIAKHVLKKGMGDPLEKGGETERNALNQLYIQQYEQCLENCSPKKRCNDQTELECIQKCSAQYNRNVGTLW